MSTGGWRITRWSIEDGRGAIEPTEQGEDADGTTLSFGDDVADVDDFAIGEAVEVELRRTGDAITVLRVWPRDFRSPVPATIGLPEVWSTALAALTGLLPEARLVMRGFDGGALRLDVIADDEAARGSATLDGVAYVQLPVTCLDFVRVTAMPWEMVTEVAPGLLDRIPLYEGAQPGSYLVCFEPAAFGDPPGYVVATGLSVGGP